MDACTQTSAAVTGSAGTQTDAADAATSGLGAAAGDGSKKRDSCSSCAAVRQENEGLRTRLWVMTYSASTFQGLLQDCDDTLRGVQDQILRSVSALEEGGRKRLCIEYQSYGCWIRLLSALGTCAQHA